MRDHYQNYTVALGLFQMLTRENIGKYFTQFCAGAVLVAIPITILFIFMRSIMSLVLQVGLLRDRKFLVSIVLILLLLVNNHKPEVNSVY